MQEIEVEIHLREALDANQRSWLVTRLGKEAGIIDARFPCEDPHRLMVRYEQTRFSRETLLDTVAEHGFCGRILGDDDPQV